MLSILIITVFVLRAFLSVPSASSLGSRRQITMLTFNIWYPSVKMKERMNALGEIVQNLKPDILTFQEVTLDNLALLRRQHWFDRYNVVPPDPELEIRKHEGKHFVVILTVHPVDKWFIYPLKNSPVYHRKLIRAETKSAVSCFFTCQICYRNDSLGTRGFQYAKARVTIKRNTKGSLRLQKCVCYR